MKHRITLVAFVLLLLATVVMSVLQPHLTQAATITDKALDVRRRWGNAAMRCLQRSSHGPNNYDPLAIDDNDDVIGSSVDEAYHDLIANSAYSDDMVLGFDLVHDNATMSCENVIPKGLAELKLSVGGFTANDTQSAKELMLRVFAAGGGDWVVGQKYDIKNEVNNANRLLTAMTLKMKAIGAMDPPSNKLKVERVAPLVGLCFSASKNMNPSNYDPGHGDFKVPGLGSFMQIDNMDRGSFSWIKQNGGTNSTKPSQIGDINLSFAAPSNDSLSIGRKWHQNNTDDSSDFYPLGQDLNEATATNDFGIVDCHFVKKNASWIFADKRQWSIGASGQINYAGKPATSSSAAPSASGDQIKDKPSCPSILRSPLSWVGCEIITGATKLILQLDEAIVDALTTNANQTFDENSDNGAGFFKMWSAFRYISMSLLVLIALAMIFSQAIGGGLVDAYTLKKVIPRLVVAVIFISLSWQILKLLIDVVDAIGLSIRALIFAPFGGTDYIVGDFAKSFGGGDTLMLFGAAAGATLAFGFIGILTMAITGLLALIVGFTVVVVRDVVVILLVVMSPIAIVCFILPNTQKIWKMWHESLSKALLMFPLIMAFLAAGRVMAYVTLHGGSTGGGGPKGMAVQGMAFVAFFAPYFLLPKTLAMAGGILGTIGGIVNDRSRGAFDRLKNFRYNRAKQIHQERMDAKSRLGGGRFGKVYRRVASGGAHGSWSPTGASRRRWQEHEMKTLDASAGSMLEEGAARGFINDDAASLARDSSMTRRGFIQRYQALGHTRQEAESALARMEEATGARIGSDAMAVAAQRYRTSVSTTAYGSGPAGLELLKTDLRDMVDKGLISEHDAAGWMKANRGRAEYSSASFGETLDFVRGGDAEQQLASAFKGADPRDMSNWHQSTVESFAGQALTNFDTALGTGDQQQIDVAAADLANYHSMLASVSPRKAQAFADGPLAQGIVGVTFKRQKRDAHGTPMTVGRVDAAGAPVMKDGRQIMDPELEDYHPTFREYIDAARDDSQGHPDFHNRIREYGSARAAAGAAAGAPPPGGAGGAGGPGGPGGAGGPGGGP